jgi:hypothetical protein
MVDESKSREESRDLGLNKVNDSNRVTMRFS